MNRIAKRKKSMKLVCLLSVYNSTRCVCVFVCVRASSSVNLNHIFSTKNNVVCFSFFCQTFVLQFVDIRTTSTHETITLCHRQCFFVAHLVYFACHRNCSRASHSVYTLSLPQSHQTRLEILFDINICAHNFHTQITNESIDKFESCIDWNTNHF